MLVVLAGVAAVHFLGSGGNDPAVSGEVPDYTPAPMPSTTTPGKRPGQAGKHGRGERGAGQPRQEQPAPAAGASTPGTGLPQGAGVTTTSSHPGGSTASLERHRVRFALVAARPTPARWGYVYLGAHGGVKDGGKGLITSWHRSVTTFGPTVNARIMAQTGAEAIRVSCVISIDGHVVVRRTTQGPYSWVVCHG